MNNKPSYNGVPGTGQLRTSPTPTQRVPAGNGPNPARYVTAEDKPFLTPPSGLPVATAIFASGFFPQPGRGINPGFRKVFITANVGGNIAAIDLAPNQQPRNALRVVPTAEYQYGAITEEDLGGAV